MPSIGTRGDTFFDPDERRRRAGISNFFNAQEIGGRFAPLDATNRRSPFGEQNLQAVSDVFFGAVTRDAGPTPGRNVGFPPERVGFGGGSEFIVGRDLLSIGEQIQLDIDIFNELERQELLPSQTTSDRSENPFDVLVSRGTSPNSGRFPAFDSALTNSTLRLARESGFLGLTPGILFGITPDQFPTFTNRFGAFAQGNDPRSLDPIIGPGQISTQSVREFFLPDTAIGLTADEQRQIRADLGPEQLAIRQADFDSFQRLRSQLPFFPQNTTLDEATQIQERRSNRARKFGESTGPVFFPGTTPGGSRGLPSGAPAFARRGRSLEPLPTSTNRFRERKLGGLSDDDDARIAGLVLSLFPRSDLPEQKGITSPFFNLSRGIAQPPRTRPGSPHAPADFISLFDGGQLIQDEEGVLISRRRPV